MRNLRRMLLGVIAFSALSAKDVASGFIPLRQLMRTSSIDFERNPTVTRIFSTLEDTPIVTSPPTASDAGVKASTDASAMPPNGASAPVNSETSDGLTSDGDDVPLPTVNGGYSHTSASKAKISAANKGKTPWNKGRARSEETKARISEGVRKRNRKVFLAKLAELGQTEEEYEAQKKEERRKKEAERRKRRTEKGGYRPTEETRAKISAVLKEKWAKGEVKKRAPATGQRKPGFKHSEETKRKISESLRKRWSKDPEFRAKKEASARKANNGTEARKRIADTLKKKWQDPEFRAYMMERIAQRKKPAPKAGNSHREKISEAMKKKWQDKEYRERAMTGMKKKLDESSKLKPLASDSNQNSSSNKARKTKARTKAKQNGARVGTRSSTRIANGSAAVAPQKRGRAISKKALPETETTEALDRSEDAPPDDIDVTSGPEGTKNGSIAQLRNDRRDLYDLLYGDDEDMPGANEAAIYDRKAAMVSANVGSSPGKRKSKAVSGGRSADPRPPPKSIEERAGEFSPSLPSFNLEDDVDDDDSLDNFDPYGLENF